MLGYKLFRNNQRGQAMKCEAKMPLPVGVPFEVVEIWYNDLYTPYTLLPTREDSVKNYAIRVAGLYFLLGDENNDSLHICDSEDFVEPVDKA